MSAGIQALKMKSPKGVIINLPVPNRDGGSFNRAAKPVIQHEGPSVWGIPMDGEAYLAHLATILPPYDLWGNKRETIKPAVKQKPSKPPEKIEYDLFGDRYTPRHG